MLTLTLVIQQTFKLINIKKENLFGFFANKLHAMDLFIHLNDRNLMCNAAVWTSDSENTAVPCCSDRLNAFVKFHMYT